MSEIYENDLHMRKAAALASGLTEADARSFQMINGVPEYRPGVEIGDSRRLIAREALKNLGYDLSNLAEGDKLNVRSIDAFILAFDAGVNARYENPEYGKR